MEVAELLDTFWSVAPALALGSIAFAVVAWIVLNIIGNRNGKQKGWGFIISVFVIFLVGVGSSLVFPGMRDKMAKLSSDPCEIVNFACRG